MTIRFLPPAEHPHAGPYSFVTDRPNPDEDES